jgi:SAM-dependent methyltransferase
MTTAQAAEIVNKSFPIAGYMSADSNEVRRSYFNIVNTVLKYLPAGRSILDFGSGPCDKTAILQTMGYKCSAYDDLQDDWHQNPGNREKIIAFAQNAGIDFKLATDYSLPFEQNHFDMVMMHSVIEHLHDSPRELLNSLLELAKPDGFLFITVPNAVNIRKRIAVLFGKTNLTNYEEYYWHSDPWRGHIREYVKDDLVKVSKYLDLEILELRSCDHMMENRLSNLTRPVYLGLTSIFRGWKDSWLLLARKKPGWQPRRNISKEDQYRIFPNTERWK